MKIALASAKFKNNDVPFNLRQIEDCMLQAKEAGAELVCFGEAFLQGFDALTWYWERDRDVAVTTDSEVFRALERLTADTGIDLLVGFLEREGEEIYSSCALLSEGRAVHNYRRISRGWKDFRKTDAHYREGREVTPFRWRGRTCRWCWAPTSAGASRAPTRSGSPRRSPTAATRSTGTPPRRRRRGCG